MACAMNKQLRFWGWLLALALSASAFAAEDKKGGEQLRRLQQKLHALEQEQSQLTQGKAELDTQLKEKSGKLEQVKRGADAANRQRAALEKQLEAALAENAALQARLMDAQQKQDETAKRLSDTGATLRLTEEARRGLDAALTARSASLSACAAKNESLHQLGVKVLTMYQEKSCVASTMQREVLTQLTRVGVENMVEELRDKLDAERLADVTRERELAQRKQAAQELAERDQRERDSAQQRKLDGDKVQLVKARQQGGMDRLVKNVKGFFERVEW